MAPLICSRPALNHSNQVFLDVTDMVDYNLSILNVNDLSNAFFCLAKHDPTVGFPYDATRLTGHLYPETANESLGKLRGACPARLSTSTLQG